MFALKWFTDEKFNRCPPLKKSYYTNRTEAPTLFSGTPRNYQGVPQIFNLLPIAACTVFVRAHMNKGIYLGSIEL